MSNLYYSVNNWLVDPSSGSIFHSSTGERKRLGEYQLKLLDVLIRNAGRTLTREELTTLVWERRVIGNNSLPNAIHALRLALEDDGKTQRIIKTIPKRGYLLEPEYCVRVEVNDNELEGSDAETALPVLEDAATEVKVEDDNGSVSDEVSANPVINLPQLSPLPYRSRGAPFFRNTQKFYLLVALIMIAVMGIAAGWCIKDTVAPHLRAEEQESGVYSNITMYEIAESNRLTRNKENVYVVLKNTLYELNQQLKTQSQTMSLYYMTVDQTLNYTFEIKNRCDRKQMVMAIYHWRAEPERLNNVILRETRRKINEMATCPEK